MSNVPLKESETRPIAEKIIKENGGDDFDITYYSKLGLFNDGRKTIPDEFDYWRDAVQLLKSIKKFMKEIEPHKKLEYLTNINNEGKMDQRVFLIYLYIQLYYAVKGPYSSIKNEFYKRIFKFLEHNYSSSSSGEVSKDDNSLPSFNKFLCYYLKKQHVMPAIKAFGLLMDLLEIEEHAKTEEPSTQVTPTSRKYPSPLPTTPRKAAQSPLSSSSTSEPNSPNVKNSGNNNNSNLLSVKPPKKYIPLEGSEKFEIKSTSDSENIAFLLSTPENEFYTCTPTNGFIDHNNPCELTISVKKKFDKNQIVGIDYVTVGSGASDAKAEVKNAIKKKEENSTTIVNKTSIRLFSEKTIADNNVQLKSSPKKIRLLAPFDCEQKIDLKLEINPVFLHDSKQATEKNS